MFVEYLSIEFLRIHEIFVQVALRYGVNLSHWEHIYFAQ